MLSEKQARQRAEALARANAVRRTLAQIKRDMKAGNLTAAEVLNDPRANSLTVHDLLVAQRYWGPFRANRVLARIGLQGATRLDQLTPGRKEILTELLNIKR